MFTNIFNNVCSTGLVEIISRNSFNKPNRNSHKVHQYKVQEDNSGNCARIQVWYFFPGANLYFCTNDFWVFFAPRFQKYFLVRKKFKNHLCKNTRLPPEKNTNLVFLHNSQNNPLELYIDVLYENFGLFC